MKNWKKAIALVASAAALVWSAAAAAVVSAAAAVVSAVWLLPPHAVMESTMDAARMTLNCFFIIILLIIRSLNKRIQ